MWEWIKKHKVAFAVICILVVFALVGVPLLINILFKVNTGISALQAEWSAGDMLGYYGAVLSFLGTVALGVLALYQNHVIKEEADKKAALLEEKEHIENMPKFRMSHKLSSGFAGGIVFDIENISENIAYEIRVYDLRIEWGEKSIHRVNNNVFAERLGPKEIISVETHSPCIKDIKELQLIAHMSCRDKYMEEHEYLLKMKCTYPNSYKCDSVKEMI